MELGLKNKVAFVAASSMGLGKSVALELAQEGASIIICGRNKQQLEKTKEEIEELTNKELLALSGDLSVAVEREHIIKSALQTYNAVDILVTNTGGPPAGKFEAVKQPVNNLILSNSVRTSVVGLMKTLSNELGMYNITVNNVMPGYTETERLKELMEKKSSFASAKNEIPLGRFGKPEEFAAAVAFLASDRANYITGVSLAVDGGWIKGMF